MSSSFYHAFTTIVTLVALTDCRKRSYHSCICNIPGKKHSATEAYIQEHKKTLFRIQTQHLLSHTASPLPHLAAALILPQLSPCLPLQNKLSPKSQRGGSSNGYSFKVQEQARKPVEEEAMGLHMRKAVSVPLRALPSLSKLHHFLRVWSCVTCAK